MKRAIETDFPFEAVDPLAEIESYRKEINRPIYHIHKWWAKRLGSVFRAIVSGSLSEGSWAEFHSIQDFSGKVVLDPFMGSGTTLGETLKLGAKAIGCDVNPVSTFLVKQALTHVSEERLIEAFDQVRADVQAKIGSYYTTLIPGIKQPSPALYYFWVKVVETPQGEEIPLFQSYVFSRNAYPKKKPLAQIWCPACAGIFAGRYDSEQVCCPHCSNTYNPQQGPSRGAKVVDSLGQEYKIKDLLKNRKDPPKHMLYAVLALSPKGEKVYKAPDNFDLKLVSDAERELEKMRSELPLPDMRVRPGFNTDQARGYNYEHWRDFFNARQLLCLGMLLESILRIQDKEVRDHLVCLFSGTLEFNNLFCSFKGEGTGAVRHMFSNHILKPAKMPLENSVWGVPGKSSGTFSTLFKSRLLKAKKYLEEPFDLQLQKVDGKRVTRKILCSPPIRPVISDSWDEFSKHNRAALVLNGDSSCLNIPDQSVDAVVTDPPYFDFVHYSELSDFFFAWLRNVLNKDYDYFNRPDSSHDNEVQDREGASFTRKIGSIFSECHRVLKPEGVMCFSFHHSKIDGWLALYNAIRKSEFCITAAHPVKAEMSVASPKAAAKNPINIDAILVCKKRGDVQSVPEPIDKALDLINTYLGRLFKDGRDLSNGDRFVVTVSQALVVASLCDMEEGDAKEFFEQVENLRAMSPEESACTSC